MKLSTVDLVLKIGSKTATVKLKVLGIFISFRLLKTVH